MTTDDLTCRRLANQRLSRSQFSQPAEVVSWLGAIQAQDYAGGKWAVAQRAVGLTDDTLDRALADGAILRTHVLRPTWHFVSPKDIRWLLELTAPRVRAASAYQLRSLALDDALIARSNILLGKALQGGKQLTRNEIGGLLRAAGIPADGLRLIYLIMSAELDQVLCSGARRGKQFTYALLEERAPQAERLDRSAPLAELARRYFTSRGPATVRDFVWWSGLTRADARLGIELAGAALAREVRDDQVFWSPASAPVTPPSSNVRWP